MSLKCYCMPKYRWNDFESDQIDLGCVQDDVKHHQNDLKCQKNGLDCYYSHFKSVQNG